VKEQSHKAEMSAALRGDFERLRARGVSAALVPQDEAEPDEEPPVVETAPSVAHEEPAELPAEPSEDAGPDEHEDEDEPPARRGGLSRFAGR
jgi:hypothetical protein